jgi:hypothetical protein
MKEIDKEGVEWLVEMDVLQPNLETRTMKTAVEQAVDALRLWSNSWNEFDKTGKNKPQPIEEVIAPFIQMEEDKEHAAYLHGYKVGFMKSKEQE